MARQALPTAKWTPLGLKVTRAEWSKLSLRVVGHGSKKKAVLYSLEIT